MCTLGTTTDDPAILTGLKDAGMAAARINTIHGTLDELAKRINAALSLGDIAVFLDLKGPQLRLHMDQNYGIARGDEFPVYFKAQKIWLNHPIKDLLHPGMKVFIENGEVKATVSQVKGEYVILKVIAPDSFTMHNNMGVNVPGVDMGALAPLTDRDKEAVRIGIQRGVYGFALSFVRAFTQISQSADFIKQELQAAGKTGQFTYLLKIEDPIGVRNLKSILVQCKQVNLNVIVLAARGDLFTEMPQEDLPLVQDAIITECHDAKVPVMVGTGIFTTMQRKPVPSRAEYVDVFHMCRQGVDWVLLSDETSNSRYPVEAVKLLNIALKKYAISEA